MGNIIKYNGKTMTDAKAPHELTEQWLKFWQENTAAVMQNPETIAQMKQFFESMQAHAAANFSQFTKKPNESQAKPSDSANDSAPDAHDGGDQYLRRIAALESRIVRLESALLALRNAA